MLLKVFLPIILILLSNRFFSVGPWWHKQSVFNVADIGNGMMGVSVALLLVFSKSRKNLFNPLSVLIVFYLSFVWIHLGLAHINYGQSLIDGLIAIRHQFYFATFFLFLMLFNDTKTMIRLMNALIIVAVVILFLSLLNYFGLPILYHKWAKGQGMRSGVTRAFIPGMTFIGFITIWLFTKWSSKMGNQLLSASEVFVLLGAHFLRQTRMRLLCIAAIAVSMLLVKRKWKELFVLAVISSVVFITLEINMKTNPILENFSSAFSNFSTQTGTWESRLIQFRIDLNEFKRHPWMGDGLSAVREHGRSLRHISLSRKTFKSDLGYSSWLKFYGIVGAIWFIIFFGIQLFMLARLFKESEGEEKTLVQFSFWFLCYILGTFITINSLMYPEGIILICLVAAFIVRLYQKRILKKLDE